MKLRLSARARREVRRIDEHWRRTADYKEHFVDELEAMLERLGDEPNLGTRYDTSTEERVLRVRLERSQYFVYYALDSEEVVVLSVWSAVRGRQPKL